ncbi:hypothetical protein [Campylobacter concisus]|uniref:Uncharacterized protein n=1 Tax=Campylobacter concisus TaxID=199 RepID=A0A0M4SBL2_9BACT|nr:hypothetical protein [Campylobacter concisus]ALF47647.1 hypothetical protein CCON33237_0968 [Campylobacter concisus]
MRTAKTANLAPNLKVEDHHRRFQLIARALSKFKRHSKFLAFFEWTADKMQIIKVLRLADMSIKTDNKRKHV